MTLRDLEALDRAYRAGGSLVDLALAVGTPLGLPPRTTWAHNVQGPSGPSWAWLRPRPGSRHIDVRLLWGAFHLDLTRAVDDRGLFVTTPVSMPNPAVWVHLREPGWVDFGRGIVPDQLGVPVIDALGVAEISRSGHSPAGLVATEIINRFETDAAWAEDVLAFFGQRTDLVGQLFRRIPARHTVTDLTDHRAFTPRSSAPCFTGAQYRALRAARGLSLREVADLASGLMPAAPVSDDQVRLLELGGRPRSPLLRARLDRVYRADGHTCIEQVGVRSDRGAFVAEIPDFWIGPIWFKLTSGGNRVADARLQVGRHHKRMRIRTGTTVTCRRATTDPVPFTIHCPDGWRVEAGVGLRPDARDVNWGWGRDDDVRERQPVNEVLLGWFGRTLEEFDQLAGG